MYLFFLFKMHFESTFPYVILIILISGVCICANDFVHYMTDNIIAAN